MNGRPIAHANRLREGKAAGRLAASGARQGSCNPGYRRATERKPEQSLAGAVRAESLDDPWRDAGTEKLVRPTEALRHTGRPGDAAGPLDESIPVESFAGALKMLLDVERVLQPGESMHDLVHAEIEQQVSRRHSFAPDALGQGIGRSVGHEPLMEIEIEIRPVDLGPAEE